MVACKTVNEYDSHQRKLKRFYLGEQAARAALIQPSSCISQNQVQRETMGHAETLKLAKANQKKQAKPKSKRRDRSKKRDTARATTFWGRFWRQLQKT